MQAAKTYQHLYARKIKAFRLLYDFTYNSCGKCVETSCACKDRICQHVEGKAATLGVKLERTNHPLRFIGCNGCVVAPHLRETCTIYLCGPAQNKPSFDKKRYDQIRRICDKIEWRLMEIEESTGTKAVHLLNQ